eukprot:TRINITY_DN6703_c0_g1_i2.p1 TRINITY_DN6703_c0_g1~~TRINITY_DN6703_c0_g1_i2.p1  ORF type:complete len:2775 (+),score=1042.87 TRINITY_DN6703_c0_g1_i2:95-8419(+)
MEGLVGGAFAPAIDEAAAADEEFSMLLQQLRRMGHIGGMSAFGDIVGDVRGHVSRGDVEEVAQVTAMSIKASRKLLRKYQGDKDEALMAWFDREVDAAALEEASDSDGDTEVVKEDVPLHCDWPAFPDAVDWVAQASGARVDTTRAVRPRDEELVAGQPPHAVLPPEAVKGDVSPRARRRRLKGNSGLQQDEERDAFAGLTIGQPVRIRRFHRDMVHSRSGWQEKEELNQRQACGRVGTITEARRRDFAACVEVSGFGRAWWDVRWLEPVPSEPQSKSCWGMGGQVTLQGERKNVKLARRYVNLLTTLVRTGDFGAFLGPVRKALERVVPASKGEVLWRTLTSGEQTVGYQLCILNPSVVSEVAAALDGDLSWRIDKKIGVSDKVVARVGKLAWTKTGCAIVSVPRGAMKMDQGALVIRNERFWEMGNVDGLDGHDVAPGLVVGTEAGKCEVCWFRHRSLVTTHRWGADDSYEVRLMPSYEQLGRLLVLLVCIGRQMQTRVAPWELMPRLTREVLAGEGGDMLQQVLRRPEFKWTGDGYSGEFDTLKMAEAMVDLVVEQWRRDKIVPMKPVTPELRRLVEELQGEPEPVGGHLGTWREAKVTVHKFYCSRASKRDGTLCHHPGGTVLPHWSCCGQMAPQGHCRQDPPRLAPAHPHPMGDCTMAVINWSCNKCMERGTGHEAQRWRCVHESCDFDLCDPCMEDSFYEQRISSVQIPLVPPAPVVQCISAKGNCWAFHRSHDGTAIMYSVNDKAPRRATSISLIVDTADGRPILEFCNPLPQPDLDGPINGFREGQSVHAAKDIYVQGRKVACEGSPGVVKGPGTSSDKRRVNVRFEECSTALNCLPHEISPSPSGRRWVCLESPLGRVAVMPRKMEPGELSLAKPLIEIPNWDDVEVVADEGPWARVALESFECEGFIQRKYIRENPRQQSGVALPREGLENFLGQLRALAADTTVRCEVPDQIEFNTGGRVPAVIVSGLQECHEEWMNGVYRRYPAEADTLVVFRKGDAVLYYKNGWWKLFSSRNFRSWLWSSRRLVGEWSEANPDDSVKVRGTPYPMVELAEPQIVPVPQLAAPPAAVTIRLPSQQEARGFVELELRAKGNALVYTHSGDGVERPPFTMLDFDPSDYFLTFTDIKKGTPLLQEGLADLLGRIRALARSVGAQHNIPDQVEVYTPRGPRSVRRALPPAELSALVQAAVAAEPGGDEVLAVVSKYGWQDGAPRGQFSPLPSVAQRAIMARELHALLGDRSMTPTNVDILAPDTSTVAIVGRKESRDRARGFLSRLRDLQEIAIRVPSDCHVVVERHRADIQHRAHAHMNVGFGGAIVRLTGTRSAIARTRRAISSLIMMHWREQQKQRRGIVLEQVVANAMEVRVKFPAGPGLRHVLQQQAEPGEPASPRRFDEEHAERKQRQARIVSLSQELTREYDRLAASLREQLVDLGLPDDTQVCIDEFLRGDRVRRGPTWADGDVDGGEAHFGTVLGNHDIDGFLMVEWDKTGKLVRHRKGPLWEDLRQWDPIRLPRMVDPASGPPQDVLKQRTAAHAVAQMDLFRFCAKRKAGWAEEDEKQRNAVRDARRGSVAIDAAEHFQGWLRNLFTLRRSAAAHFVEAQTQVERDAAQLQHTLALVEKLSAESGRGPTRDPSTLGITIVTGDVLEEHIWPFDVATKMALPETHRMQLPVAGPLAACRERAASLCGAAPADICLWAFEMAPNGTLRPKVLLTDGALPLAQVPRVSPDSTCRDVQLFAHAAPGPHRQRRFAVAQGGVAGVFASPAGGDPVGIVSEGTEVSLAAPTAPLAAPDALVRVQWTVADEGREGYVRRGDLRPVPELAEVDPRACPSAGLLFFKSFRPEAGTMVRTGFAVCDFAQAAVGQATQAAAECAGRAHHPQLFYVEESPECLRRLEVLDRLLTLRDCGLSGGAVLVAQDPLPSALQRSPQPGDSVSLAPSDDSRGVLPFTAGLGKGEEGRVVQQQSDGHIVVEIPGGERMLYRPSELVVLAKNEGLPYSHALVPSWAQHEVHRRDGAPVSCPQGHRLCCSANPRHCICNACGCDGRHGSTFWGCRGCDWDLCVMCFLLARASLVDKSSAAYQPAGRLESDRVRLFLKDHSDRLQRMVQSLAKHRDMLFDTVNEILMHLRRMGKERQHQRRQGWDLMLQLMDETGCLLELEEEGVLIVGRYFAVRKATERLRELQSVWPPPSVPTRGSLELPEEAVRRLFGRGGLLARAVQFESGCDSIDYREGCTLAHGPADAVQRAAESIRRCLALPSLPGIVWAPDPSAGAPEAAPEGQDGDCPICICPLDPGGTGDDAAFGLACGHKMHIGCGLGLAENHSAESRRDPLPCPAQGCEYVMRAEEFGALRATRPGQLALTESEYYDNLLMYALRRHPKVVACPFEGCEGWAVTGGTAGAVENLFCFSCQRLFCPICRQLGHFFSRCEDVRSAARARAGEEVGRQMDDEEASRKAITALCRPCPRCGVQVSRTEGCPHMTCKVCKFEFCYDCLLPVPHVGECDKSRLEDRMRSVRAEHDGVLYHKYTHCDACGVHPMPEGDDAWTCLHCLHWSICGRCERGGQTCGIPGHFLAKLPRGDEPPAEAVPRRDRGRWREHLLDVPYYDDVDWDELLRRDLAAPDSSCRLQTRPPAMSPRRHTRRRRHTAAAAAAAERSARSSPGAEQKYGMRRGSAPDPKPDRHELQGLLRSQRRSSAGFDRDGTNRELRRLSMIGLKRADTRLFDWGDSGDEDSNSSAASSRSTGVAPYGESADAETLDEVGSEGESL